MLTRTLFNVLGHELRMNVLIQLTDWRNSDPLMLKNLIKGHLNINSIRGKFTEASELLTEELLDVLFLSETKLDVTFPSPQFHVTGYKCHRADRNQQGWGIMAYVRNDLPRRRRSHLEHVALKPVETMIIEMIKRHENGCSCVYIIQRVNLNRNAATR